MVSIICKSSHLSCLFSYLSAKIFKNTFLHRTPPVAASEKLKTEAVMRRCSVKKGVLRKVFANTVARDSILIRLQA